MSILYCRRFFQRIKVWEAQSVKASRDPVLIVLMLLFQYNRLVSSIISIMLTDRFHAMLIYFKSLLFTCYQGNELHIFCAKGHCY